ncbi:MAG: 4Fe-4S binding protein [Deltaproteobacteria bacterium]|nr:4Fe-4S binding protein [Deltaproteobacteria bacterium]
MSANTYTNRMIKIDGGIIGPQTPKLKNVKAKIRADYPGVPAAILDVAEVYSSPKLAGPPLCDELVALMVHVFSEEEATVARHIGPKASETADAVAAAAHRPIEEVRPILERLANEKRILLSYGMGDQKKYTNLPLSAGSFEMVLMRPSMDTITDWHRRFCELFAALWETGYGLDYWGKGRPVVKYLPVGQAIEHQPMALPTDQLEALFDRYDIFGVTLCQCRIVEELVGRGCGREKEACMALGVSALPLIQSGRFRRIEKQEAWEIKKKAEAEGLVSWITVRDPELGGSCCSCCGCCCHMMRTITEFNMPGMIAPPHFIPHVDFDKCTYCGKCALACPMGALVVDIQNNRFQYDSKRCIGCAQCAVACSKIKAIDMVPVPNYEPFKQDRKALL